jgi:hypothetical protein
MSVPESLQRRLDRTALVRPRAYERGVLFLGRAER